MALTLQMNLGGQLGGPDLLGADLALTLKVNLGGAVWGEQIYWGQIGTHFRSEVEGHWGVADWHSLWK